VNFGEVNCYSGTQLPTLRVASRVVSWLLAWRLVLVVWGGTEVLGDVGDVCFWIGFLNVSGKAVEYERGVNEREA
jgi:hypothetical protein